MNSSGSSTSVTKARSSEDGNTLGKYYILSQHNLSCIFFSLDEIAFQQHQHKYLEEDRETYGLQYFTNKLLQQKACLSIYLLSQSLQLITATKCHAVPCGSTVEIYTRTTITRILRPGSVELIARQEHFMKREKSSTFLEPYSFQGTSFFGLSFHLMCSFMYYCAP